MSASLTVDDSLFTKRARALLSEIGKTEDEFLDEQAPLLFGDVAKATPPHAGGRLNFRRRTYGSNDDKKAGENAVRGDIYRSMRPVAPASRWEQKSIKKAVRRKDTRALTEIFRHAEGSAYQGFEVHEFNNRYHLQARNRRGRVRKQRKILVLPKSEFNRYLRSAVKTVGRGKALFAWAAMELGGPQAPKWVSRHFWKYRARVQRGPGYRSATASGVQLVHVVRLLPWIESNRAAQAEKRLLFLTRQAGRQSGFKVA